MSNINVCYTCDNNYAPYVAVSLASVLKNANEDDALRFYVISNDISEDNKQKILALRNYKNCEITILTPAETVFDNFKGITTSYYLPIASFFRLKIASLIQNEDKILYIDPDTVVETSLKKLFDTDIENYFCAGIKDIGHKKYEKRLCFKKGTFYVNSGVLLLNLKKWREENAEDKFVKTSQEIKDIIKLGDQDLINKAFEDKILIVDGKWNVQVVNYCSRSDYSQKCNIIHYMGGQKPWKFGSYIPLRDRYFKYLELTDYEKPTKDWHRKSNIQAFWAYLKWRPLFMFRPGFFKAIFYSFFKI